MQSRPRYKVVSSSSDKLLEAAGWLCLAILWFVTLRYFGKLPGTIPVHFTLNGEADSFGNKQMIFSLPIISTIILSGISILSKYPHLFNYPSVINDQTAPAQYTNAVKMMRVVKLAIVVIFLVILLHTITVATGSNNLWAGPWVFYLALVLLILPVIYFVIKGLKIKPN